MLPRNNELKPARSSSTGRLMQSARRFFYSKAFSRTVLLVIILLLLADLYRSPQHHLHRLGTPNSSYESNEHSSAAEKDWSQYAYCQYVTAEAHLCNSLVMFESLSRLGVKADKLMLFPEQWLTKNTTEINRQLAKARDEYNVTLQPVHLFHFGKEKTWADGFTKFLAWNQTDYKRVLVLDSDATVLQPMDELFDLPSAPAAIPRAYWLESQLTGQLLLVEPSELEFKRIQEALEQRQANDYDMEIINTLYKDSALTLPHRAYDLLTGEFKAEEHHKFLGNEMEVWDPNKVLAEAKFVHFSDWPYPKPWVKASRSQTEQIQPKCHVLENGDEDCKDREIWLWFYSDFQERRQRVCGFLQV
ncbi:hypothetical protein LTR37_007277 [Vermiconidia calcicola]|uniref:Uncharacterized protein n=1 Tax=Vermiconidia calcicola TaxID=1690605 RepID=A0ACC3NFC2_9PEZI|nr:hypothetical protein LTR37_007277 [Vermiconidia calcicola]